MYVRVTNPLQRTDLILPDLDSGGSRSIAFGATSLVFRTTPEARLEALKQIGRAGFLNPAQYIPIVGGMDGAITAGPFEGFDTINDVLTYLQDHMVLPVGAVINKFTVAVPSSSWIVNHSLGRQPMVDVYLTSGEKILTGVTVTDSVINVTLSDPQSGYIIYA